MLHSGGRAPTKSLTWWLTFCTHINILRLPLVAVPKLINHHVSALNGSREWKFRLSQSDAWPSSAVGVETVFFILILPTFVYMHVVSYDQCVWRGLGGCSFMGNFCGGSAKCANASSPSVSSEECFFRYVFSLPAAFFAPCLLSVCLFASSSSAIFSWVLKRKLQEEKVEVEATKMGGGEW